ncbi:MAG: TIR domain-containing protein [Myxococcales bacterium]|nr:TIR domain-containing protein [Myxococcales bacterium]
MSDRHNVFVSYHHKNDESYRKIFELRFGNKFGVVIPGAVQIGDIDTGLQTETIRQLIRDEYLRDTSVTVVLIGAETWQRKHVDWEISSSIRDTKNNPRSGLLGLLLPTYPAPSPGKYNPRTIPPRLHDNIECGFAAIAQWSNDPDVVRGLVHEAYLRKKRLLPDNALPLFKNNRSGAGWS